MLPITIREILNCFLQVNKIVVFIIWPYYNNRRKNLVSYVKEIELAQNLKKGINFTLFSSLQNHHQTKKKERSEHLSKDA